MLKDFLNHLHECMNILSGAVSWGGGGRREVMSEAREENGIRGGVAGERVGGGGVGRAAIEWRHQARHRPARPRLRPHLRAAQGRCAAPRGSVGGGSRLPPLFRAPTGCPIVAKY
uniref:Uncharacterized protein n=1 Tax=Arundo donax TaxID=35708 RepID=A0A0A9G5T0_ARUDO